VRTALEQRAWDAQLHRTVHVPRKGRVRCSCVRTWSGWSRQDDEDGPTWTQRSCMMRSTMSFGVRHSSWPT